MGYETTASTATNIHRRHFLKQLTSAAAGAVAAPWILPARASGQLAPSERITLGCIGVGRQSTGVDMPGLMHRGAQVVAVCDVDTYRTKGAKNFVEQFYAARAPAGSFQGCDVYGDYRELCARDDIDAVLICTPDHWHILNALEAVRNGKDVYIEKPMSFSIEEGRLLSDTVRQFGRVLQVGSQQRSSAEFRLACELVRNNRLGKLHTITVILGTDPATDVQPVQPVPEQLDYDMWLGPAPQAPYTEKRVHPRVGYGRPGWLRIRDYCAGMITGWGSHHIDIAQWGHGSEYSAVVELQGSAEFPANGLWNVHGDFHVEGRYEDGVRLIIKGGNNGVRFEGSDGWIWVTRGQIDASDKNLLREPIGASEVHLYHSDDHHQNFLDCVRSRKDPIANVEIGHRSATMCYLADIAMRSGRKLHWDPQAEQFINDPIANRRLSQPMRSPWHL